MSTKVDTLLIDPGTATTGQVLTYNATTARWAAQTPATNVGDDCPIGSILYFAAQTPPRGWLVCDGSNLSPVGEYADLFAIIGNIYGTVGGNFKLPDLRGEFIRGWSSNRAGVDPGRLFGGFQSDEIKSHTHAITLGYRLTTSPGGAKAFYSDYPNDQTTSQATGGAETRPRNIALLPCIKAVKTLPGSGDPLNFITKPATATNGQILSYNSSGNTWIASNPPTSLPTTATGGQVLTYNGSTSTWVASASPAGARSTSSFTIDGSSLAKAWVNFDGTGTTGTNQTIRASYNVNRVYKNSTGIYTVVFSTPFENNSYIVNGIGGGNAGVDSHNNSISLHLNNVTTLSCEIFSDSGDGAEQDSQVMCCTFFASGGNLTGTANVFDTTPVGTVTYFAASAAPVGYMICNGAILSRAAYPELFTVIGTIYNTGGEGTSNFRLPNLLGEFIRGWDNGRGINAGRVFGSYEADMFKAHNHTISTRPSLQSGGSENPPLDSSGDVVEYNSSTVGGTETRPRNVALLPCIKVVRTVTGDTTIINYVEKPATATNGQVLSYNSTTGRWVATNNTASLPSGSNGQVLTYNGLTETWVASAAPASSNITAVTLAGTMVILQEQQPSGTPAGNASSGSWTKRNLNTEVSDVGGLCQLSNGQFALLAGTYAINASAPCYRGDKNRIRLFNVTDNSTACLGTIENAWGTTQTRSSITHIFTIPSTKTFEIQHYITTGEGEGLGVALGQGTEIYTNVEITRSVALSAGNPIIDTVPVGTVSWFTASTVPVGYLECNGSSVSRSVYSDLFAVIGTRYNTGGEGTTNFRLPDLRGEFIRGWSNGRDGVDVGRTLGSSQPDGIKKHQHQYKNSTLTQIQAGTSLDNLAGTNLDYLEWDYTGSSSSGNVGFGMNSRNVGPFSGLAADNFGPFITIGDNIGSTSDTRPRNVALLPCIKAQRTIFGTTNALNFIDRPANPREGQTLVYREATGKWEAGAPSAGGSIVAWVKFDGTRNVNNTLDTAVNSNRRMIASNNVTSVTKNAIGDYTIIFATPLPDTDYIVNGTGHTGVVATSNTLATFTPNIMTDSQSRASYRAPTVTSCRVYYKTSTIVSGGQFNSWVLRDEGVDLPFCYVYVIR
jgi:microcystin-dependent protein